MVSSSMTAVTSRLTNAMACSRGAAVASCSVAGDRLANAALAAGDEAIEMAGATARSEAKYTAQLMVTIERSSTPANEMGRRTRAAASLCTAVAEVRTLQNDCAQLACQEPVGSAGVGCFPRVGTKVDGI